MSGWTTRIVAIAASLATIAVGVSWLARSSGQELGTPAATASPAAPALTISDSAIQEKIARKRAKAAGRHREAQNPDGYSEYRRLIRPHDEGVNTTQLLLDAKRKVEQMDAVEMNRDAGLWNWEWLGPGNIGGRVRAVLLHPTQPGTMWAGSAGGGIWKTDSGGSTWYPLHDLLPSLAITSLAMDPNDPDVIYAGTGEGFGNIDALPGAGIFKTFDGGGVWTQLPNTVDPDMRFINDIAAHPTLSNLLLACGRADDGSGIVFRTLNSGNDWIVVLSTPGVATDVKFDPDDPDIVICGTNIGAWRSDATGTLGSWTELSVGGSGALPDTTGRCEIAFHEGSDVVYASCSVPEGPGQPTGQIWRSLDNGVTWSVRHDLIRYLGTQGWYNNVIWVEPEFSNSIIVGGINIFKSIDGGTTLTAMSSWPLYLTGASAHADQHAITPHIDYGVGDNLTIFFGNDGGVQKTTLGFLTTVANGWQNLANNLGITQFYHADVTPNGDRILGGSQDNDDLRFLRTGGAQSWYQAETGDGTFCAIDPVDPSYMYACYPWLGMQRSTDAGFSYHDIDGGIGDAGNPARALFISPFALDKTDPTRLLAGGASLWLSTSRGNSWQSVFGPLVNTPLCSAIEMSPTVGTEVMWAGYDSGAIWRSENDAATWLNVETSAGGPLPDSPITDIEISPHDPDVVLVSFGGYLPDRVWLTVDNGATWNVVTGTGNNALPEIHVSCVTFHPIEEDWIYAGTDIGLFASEDMGQNWNVTSRYGVNEGPVFTEIADLIWHSYSTLIAVTHGRGMFECMPLPVVWVDQANTGEEDGTSLRPWNTFDEGYDAIGPGAYMILRGAEYDEGAVEIRKRIEIKGSEGVVLIR